MHQLWHAITDFLIFLTKADPYNTFARNIFKVLDGAWNEQQKAFLKIVWDKIKTGKQNMTEHELELLLKAADYTLGKDFGDKVKAEIEDHAAAVYQFAHKEIGIEFEHNIEDKRAIKWLAEDTMYWTLDHYEKDTREKMNAACAIITKHGLDRRQAGEMIAGSLPTLSRSRSYWEGLANHITTRSREFGRVSAYGNAKVMYLKINAVMDHRTSEICKQMNGRIIKVAEARALREELMAVPATEEGKQAIKTTIAPWLKPKQIAEQVVGVASKDLPRGLSLPPYHYNCRTRSIIAYQDEQPSALAAAGKQPKSDATTPKPPKGGKTTTGIISTQPDEANAHVGASGQQVSTENNATQNNNMPKPSSLPKGTKPGKPTSATTSNAEQLAGPEPDLSPLPVPKPTHDAEGFPLSVDALTPVKKLGGSTGAMLMEDRNGNKFVVKRGASAEHLIEEATADGLYRATGIDVPEFRLLKGPNGEPVKIAQFIKGETLAAYEATHTPAEIEKIHKKLRANFAADALLGNWDVIGLERDNIMIDAKGTPYRIDNGGALRFRALGERKSAQQFSDAVTELKTLLDKNVNAQTAAVFGGITPKELQKQIERIAAARTKILAATPDDLQGTIKARLDFLQGTLPHAKEDTMIAGITDEFAAAVVKARMNGKTIFADRADIEDNQILFWNEDPAQGGNATTRAALKLTGPAGKRIEDLIKKYAAGIAPSEGPDPYMLDADTYFDTILATAKTINTHAHDGNYNPATIEKFGEAEYKLRQFLKTATGPEKQMAEHYTAYVKIINDALKDQKQIGTLFERYWHKTEAPKPAKDDSAPWTEIKRGDMKFQFKTLDKGFVKIEGKGYDYRNHTNGSGVGLSVADIKSGYSSIKNPAYIMKVDGVEITYIPNTVEKRNAFRGQIYAKTDGPVTAQTLTKITNAINSLGTTTETPTDAWKELVYLRKGIAIRHDLFENEDDYMKIVDDTKKSDEEKVLALKSFIKENSGISLPNKQTADYNWNAQNNCFGENYAVNLYRWDLTRETIAKEMADYMLTHYSTMGLTKSLDGILNSGGYLSPVMEMARKGMGKGPCMSPEADIVSGGANYSYVRIQKHDNVTSGTICFKINNLARIDAHSYDQDWMGTGRSTQADTFNAKQIGELRAIGIKGFKNFALNGSNETLFKQGINVLDEIDYIKGGSERKAIIDVFKKHGYYTLPDGRKIEDVVR